MISFKAVKMAHGVQDPKQAPGPNAKLDLFFAPEYSITLEDGVLSIAYGEQVVDVPFTAVREALRDRTQPAAKATRGAK